MVGGDKVSVNGQAQYPQAALKVVLPNRLVPLGWAALQQSPPQMSLTRILISPYAL